MPGLLETSTGTSHGPKAATSLAARPAWLRYGVPALGIAAVCLLRRALWPLFGPEMAFLFVWPVVIFAAWYGGFSAGALATLLSALAAILFFFEPRHFLSSSGLGEQIGVLVWILVGIAISRTMDRSRRASVYNRTLLEASLDPLVTIGPDGKITDVNTATEKVTGCARLELIGTDFADYFTEPEKARQGYRQVFREGTVRDYPLEIRGGNDHHRHVLYNASVYRDDAGKVIGVFAAARDVTERRRTEEALRAANAYNRSLIEASLDPLVTIGPDGKITDVNTATEKVTGCARLELIGTDFADYFTEPEKARQGYRQVFREGTVRDYPLEIRGGNDHHRHVLYNASVYRDEAGKVIGVFAAARDVTERRRTEEALRAANAYNRSLIEASLDPLVTIGPDGKITDVNAATEQVTGRGRQELIGTDFADYFTDVEQARAGYQQVFRKGSVRDYALDIRHGDGRLTPVLYNASVYRDEPGRVIGVFAAARDISERRRMEAALAERAAALERSNRELEQFAYVASHDLQEPLRMVASYTELLGQRYQGKLDDKADKFIHYIVDGAARMQTLINDLLTFSRVTTRAKPFALTSAETALAEVLSNLQRTISEKAATVTHDPLPDVMVDATQFEQVLQNLVGNALKFCESKPRVHLAAERKGDEWVFSVRDNGIGIAPEHRERLFVLFQRLHSREQYPGTGIGLAVCKKVVERHGGRIWFDSEPGKGSTFYFSIPVRGETP